MRIKNVVVEEQIQWVLSYVQKMSVDIWKENIIENLESRSFNYVIVEEFLSDLKEKLGGEKNEIIKVVGLKKVLWQPLDTMSNSSTISKSLSRDI